MQPIRGTKDILPHEVKNWQKIYEIIREILSQNSYHEIRTPIIENTELFRRSIGDFTDIVNKEMYTFNDQGKRLITLRPEGTAGIARAFISNKLYLKNKINRLWYLGPMFRYERPQQGRQRQFHQLGIECIGSLMPIADVEVIRLAVKILEDIHFTSWTLEINSIGNIQERERYTNNLISYLSKYKYDLDINSQIKLKDNPLRILDSKDLKTQEILLKSPKLKNYLGSESLTHFNTICNQLNSIGIKYEINDNLVRGLDYYNYTAFEIKTQSINQQNTICGGGRYDQLIKQLGGPYTPSVGWAMGIERLIMTLDKKLSIKEEVTTIYIVTSSIYKSDNLWNTVKVIDKYKLNFEIDLSNNNLNKQLRRANQIGANICFIIKDDEIKNKYITVKWMRTHIQQTINLSQLENYLKYLKKHLNT
uniref:Histidine--tRNA ligase, chloroplastic n=1 Tax=Chondria sp. (in: red algae) TaxID=1982705 RepID=A0A1Z1MQM8_9FLOR|nr:Histidine-tRNA ligase [Chondria sp. (in: red algae)]